MERSDDALAGEYALRLLLPAEERAFEARLAAEPALSATLRDWETWLAGFADEIASAAPPADLRRRVIDAVFGARQGGEPMAGLRSRLAFWRGLAALGTVAALILAALLVQQYRLPIAPQIAPGTAAGPNYVAEIASPGSALRLAALYDQRTGALSLNRTAGAAAEGRVLQLWLIPPNEVPISLGVLPTAARTTVSVPEGLQPRVNGATLAVSDEPPGGSPTGQPTGAILGTGTVTEI
jgi:anti-sigma-K factor RskA